MRENCDNYEIINDKIYCGLYEYGLFLCDEVDNCFEDDEDYDYEEENEEEYYDE